MQIVRDYTVQSHEVCRRFDFAWLTLRNRVLSGKFPAPLMDGGKPWRWLPADLDKYEAYIFACSAAKSAGLPEPNQPRYSIRGRYNAVIETQVGVEDENGDLIDPQVVAKNSDPRPAKPRAATPDNEPAEHVS